MFKRWRRSVTATDAASSTANGTPVVVGHAGSRRHADAKIAHLRAAGIEAYCRSSLGGDWRQPEALAIPHEILALDRHADRARELLDGFGDLIDGPNALAIQSDRVPRGARATLDAEWHTENDENPR